MVEVTSKDRELADAVFDSGTTIDEFEEVCVLIAAYREQARLEGIRLGLKAAAKAVKARQVVYYGKAERHSILEQDCRNPHEMFTHTAEAMDFLSDELDKIDPTTIAKQG